MLAPSAAPAPSISTLGPWRWRVCIFLLFATALSYLDRQALSVAAPLVSKDLGLDNRSLGTLLGAFFYTYAGMHLFIGYFLDRYNIRFIYGSFVALWSFAQIAGGLSTNFIQLYVSRLFLGAFETAGQTGAARIIARIVPSQDRAFANGIMMSGGSLGAVIAPVLVLALAARFGWRTAFLILGAVGLVWAAAWIWWFRPPREVLYGSPVETREPWRDLLAKRHFWACFLGAAFCIPILHIVSSWIPTFLVQHWKIAVGGGLSTYLFLVYLGLDIGFIGGGFWIRRMVAGGRSSASARRFTLIAAACLMLLAAAVPFANSIELTVLLIALMNIGRAAWGAIFLTYNQEISAGRVGMVAGLMGATGSLAGALLVSWIGAISQIHGFAPVFFGIAALVVLGTIPLLLVNWEVSK
jgi:ACS family hexuronate transporter-like MFS transporter